MVHQTSFKLICPAGLVIDRINLEADLMLICARSSATGSACPECGLASSRIHSRYVRCLADLPVQGHAVRLNVQVRRFRCDNAGCGRRISGETLAETVATRAARRTSRLENIVHHLGLALGGRPAAGLARRLMLPVSRDTLLRVVRRRAMELTTDVRVLGIDDFAWKGGQRYGTVLCDLERRRIIDLLPDREAGTVEAWLASHPNIAIVSRDRGAGYGQAASRAIPQAMQVADRWHPMENASAAFLQVVRQSMRCIRKALTSTAIDPALLTCAERLQYEGFLRRQDDSRAIKRLAEAGQSIKAITRQTGRSRKLVRNVLRGGDGDIFRSRQRMLEPYLVKLDADWRGGCRNGAALWRGLRSEGFCGSLRVVAEWATRRRRGERSARAGGRVPPPARQLSRMMTMGRDNLSKADAIIVAAVETGVPSLAAARQLMERFHQILRGRDADGLTPWLIDSTKSLLASFANGIKRDFAAVSAAVTEPWSNGQTEGQITKLKMVKRQMYGRAKMDLLRARLIVPA
jgi:transposase